MTPGLWGLQCWATAVVAVGPRAFVSRSFPTCVGATAPVGAPTPHVMEVFPIPLLEDNYGYLVVDRRTGTCSCSRSLLGQRTTV